MQMAALRTPWSTDRNACMMWYAPARRESQPTLQGALPVHVLNPSQAMLYLGRACGVERMCDERLAQGE